MFDHSKYDVADIPIPSAASFLEEDAIKVAGQNYALISFCSKHTRQKAESLEDGKVAIKIRGVFNTREEAELHIKKLMKTDPHFDVFLVDMFRWLVIPPDMDKIDDQKYQEKFLSDLFEGKREAELMARQHFAERKKLAMEQGIDSVLTEDERIPKPEEETGEGASSSST